jgi:two-component system CheB/CheR fusion protein
MPRQSESTRRAQEAIATARDAARLVGAAGALAGAQDLASVMEVVGRLARELTGADGVTFVLREGDRVHYADEDAIAPLWKGQRFPASACISGWAMIHREPVVIEDIYQDDRIPHGAYRSTFVKSLAMVPVRLEDPVAAIGAYWAERHRATDREVAALTSVAGLTSVALTNVALYAELREAAKARDEFLTVAAHELRTPVTPIALQVGWALRALDRGDVAGARAALLRGQQNIARAARLIDDLLDLSGAMEQRVVLQRERVELGALVAEVMAHLHPSERSRIQLQAPQAVRGRWDRACLEKVLETLVSNALKFGGAGAIEVRLEQLGGTAQIAVVDHGMGISDADQQRIFEKFQRAVSLEHFGGLGLGLWLARRLVEAHGGKVEVASSLGQGATFTVTVPGAEVELAEAGPRLAVFH